MFQRVFLIVASFCITLPAIAQNDTIPAYNVKNAVYLELGGIAIIHSWNYERVFDGRYSLRVGVANYFDNEIYDNLIVVPVVANGLTQLNRSTFFELGIGGVFSDSNTRKPSIGLTMNAGLRFQNMRESGFIGRLSFTPLLSTGGSVFPWAGASVGFTF